MDNRPFSVFKRSLRVVADYISCLFLFAVIGVTALGASGEAYAKIIFAASCVMFFIMLTMIYSDMHQMAFKEKRPQYNINPSKYKGGLYGLLGIVPIWLIQLIIVLVQVPAEYETLHMRAFQLVSSPIYWLAKLMGNHKIDYSIALLTIIIIAFLGYWAGYLEFSLKDRLYKLIGYTPKPRKRYKPKKK